MSSVDQHASAPGGHMHSDAFVAQADAIASWIARYWNQVGLARVRADTAPGAIFHALPPAPPEAPEPVWDSLLQELDTTIVPGLTHWQHPSFFAYFPANASGPAVLGELLSAGLGVQGMLWSTSPACTEVEMRVMDWLAGAFGLPPEFTHEARLAGRGRSAGDGGSVGGGGVIHSTASEATLVAMVAARHRALRGLGDDDPQPHLTLYASAEAHASVVKAAMIAGLARRADDGRHVRRVPVDRAGRMDVEHLREMMTRDRASGRLPFFVVATLGTTGTGAFDDLHAIGGAIGGAIGDAIPDPSGGAHSAAGAPPSGNVSQPWLHVDGAWGLNACVCPEFRGMLRGIERVDSLCVNPHKWLLTNFDCDAFFVRDAAALTDAMSITPEYLRPTASQQTDHAAMPDFRDWQVPLGRRFRALKLWLVMRHYGMSGLRTFIREHVEMAQRLEEWVREDARFAVHARSLSLVCLRLVERDGESRAQADARTLALLERVNASGRAMVTHTRAPADGTAHGPAATMGPVVIRIAVGGVATRERHCRMVWDLLKEHA